MFSFIEGLPDNVLAVRSAGRITAEDYRERLEPKVDALLAKGGKLRSLFVVENEVGDVALDALWEDQKFDHKHWRDFSHVAVVTDHGWIRTATTLFAPFFPARVRVFPLSELDEAKDWIVEAA